MTVQVWTAIFVVLTFGLYTAIAWWTRASSTREFYVAGKGVSPLANGMATAADWMRRLFHFHGRNHCFCGIRWLGVSDGMDRGVCVARGIAGRRFCGSLASSRFLILWGSVREQHGPIFGGRVRALCLFHICRGSNAGRWGGLRTILGSAG